MYGRPAIEITVRILTPMLPEPRPNPSPGIAEPARAPRAARAADAAEAAAAAWQRHDLPDPGGTITLTPSGGEDTKRNFKHVKGLLRVLQWYKYKRPFCERQEVPRAGEILSCTSMPK
jgi:hypothetical protein